MRHCRDGREIVSRASPSPTVGHNERGWLARLGEKEEERSLGKAVCSTDSIPSNSVPCTVGEEIDCPCVLAQFRRVVNEKTHK